MFPIHLNSPLNTFIIYLISLTHFLTKKNASFRDPIIYSQLSFSKMHSFAMPLRNDGITKCFLQSSVENVNFFSIVEKRREKPPFLFCMTLELCQQFNSKKKNRQGRSIFPKALERTCWGNSNNTQKGGGGGGGLFAFG